MSKSVLPVFSSRSFMVYGLIFRSLTHFEFIFVCGVRECSKFILWHVAVQFSQNHFIEETDFSPLYILASFVVNLFTINVWAYFWVLHSVVSFEISKCKFSQFSQYFSRLFWLTEVPWDFMWFLGDRVFYFCKKKKKVWDFVRDCIDIPWSL